jgi:DNA-binding XRE family transcriptional regulator
MTSTEENPQNPSNAPNGDGEDEATRTRRMLRNNVRRLREDRLLSKAELARRAGVSVLTVDRVESGMVCRMDTKRKIILGLGLEIEDKDKVFGEEVEVPVSDE